MVAAVVMRAAAAYQAPDFVTQGNSFPSEVPATL